MNDKWPTEKIVKASLLYLHIMAGIFAVAVMLGREAPIIDSMFATTMAGIASTLGILVINKGWKVYTDTKANTTVQSTLITKTTTEPKPDESISSPSSS